MKKVDRIIPAVLTENFSIIENTCLNVKDFVNCVQIDVCDGKYTKQTTWPFVGGQISISGDFEMPGWEDLEYEFDLLVEKPEKILERIIEFDASRCVVHVDTMTEDSLIQIVNLLNKFDIEIGIGTNVNTDLEKTFSFIELANSISENTYVQIMGIKNIGNQGEPFCDESISLIKEIKDKFPKNIVQVDGSVTDTTIKKLSAAGADRFVVGSWIKRSGLSAELAIQTLNDLI